MMAEQQVASAGLVNTVEHVMGKLLRSSRGVQHDHDVPLEGAAIFRVGNVQTERLRLYLYKEHRARQSQI